MLDVRILNMIFCVITVFKILLGLLFNNDTLFYVAIFCLLICMMITAYSVYKDLKEEPTRFLH